MHTSALRSACLRLASLLALSSAVAACDPRWELEQDIAESDAPPASVRGLAVAAQGSFVAVTVADPPGVDVYHRAGAGDWAFVQRITPRAEAPALDASYHYGESLALDGNRLAIGVPKYVSSGGASGTEFGYVDLYRLSAGRFEFDESVTAPIAPGEVTSSNFATSIDLQGDVLVAGSNFDTERIGRVFVFKETAGVFTLWQRLRHPEATSDRHFGFAVALAGERLAVAQPGVSTFSGGRNGEVVVYRREASGFALEQRVPSPEPGTPGSPDRFGSALALSATHLAATQPGRVHLFELGSAGFAPIYSAAAAVGSYFSVRPTLALAEVLLVVGENAHDPGGTPNRGRVRLHDVRNPEATHAELLDPQPGGREFGAAVAATDHHVVVSTGARGATPDDTVFMYRLHLDEAAP